MRITFSDHAEIKIAQRKISKQYIVQTLSKPHHIYYQSTGRDQYFRKFKRFYLKVVAVKLKYRLHVITLHWIAKLPRK